MTAPDNSQTRLGQFDMQPITSDELPVLFECLKNYDIVFLAVSGGADSTAMMHLIAEWRTAGGHKCDLHVLTVDHGLRPEARSEADAVATAAAGLELPSQILTWQGVVPKTGVQQAARDLRYELLLGHINGEARTNGNGDTSRCVLVTAHHRDDLAETVLMRLARGAGVDGLSAMQPISKRDGVSIVRPLLDVPKARLLATLDARGQTWLQDPSNQNHDFERVRLRAAAPTLRDLGLTDAAVARSARRMARARSALEDMTSAVLCPHLSAPLLTKFGVFSWYWLPADTPDEIAIRVLMRLLPAIGGSASALRLRRLERLLADMQLGNFSGATLGNCVIASDKTFGIVIYREPNRGALPVLTTTLDVPVIWDNRFEISAAQLFGSEMQIRPFIRNDLKAFSFEAPIGQLSCPIEALGATPVVEDRHGPLWIPALDMHRERQEMHIEHGSAPELSCRFRVDRLGCDTGARPLRSKCTTS